MPRRPASAPLRIALPLALCAVARLAAAQNAAFERGDVAAEAAPVEVPEAPLPWRPRLSLAAGMGATFDATGFAGGTHTIPAFFAVGGFGDGLTGFDICFARHQGEALRGSLNPAGRAITERRPAMSDAPDSPVSPTPEKGVADLLAEAFQLYRLHAKPLLITCALLFVPASIIKSLALSAILAPTVALATSADPTAMLAGGFGVYLLGLLGTLVTAFFLYGIVVPLTNGALTISVADRILGGKAEWREVWMLLFRRLGMLLSAVVPAAIVVAIGFVFFIIPGLVLGMLFAFVSPVVLIEGIGGRAALERSTTLVRSDWLRVTLVVLVFGLLRAVAQMVAGLLIPHSAIFLSSLLGDLITMVLLPVPVLGMVLLYFDVRRKRDNFTPDHLRADLEALKGA